MFESRILKALLKAKISQLRLGSKSATFIRSNNNANKSNEDKSTNTNNNVVTRGQPIRGSIRLVPMRLERINDIDDETTTTTTTSTASTKEKPEKVDVELDTSPIKLEKTKKIIYENHQALLVNPNLNTNQNKPSYNNNNNNTNKNYNNNSSSSSRPKSFQTLPNIGSALVNNSSSSNNNSGAATGGGLISGLFRNSTKKNVYTNNKTRPKMPISNANNAAANDDVISETEWASLNEAQRHNDELIEHARKQIEIIAGQFEMILATARTVEVKLLNDMIDQLDGLTTIISV